MTGMMNLPGIESFAQIALSRVLNSLPEGLLIALCAWILLRMLGRQNAGTRFAVWLVALVGVAGLPLLSSFAMGRRALVAGHAAIGAGHAEMIVPGFWAVLFVALWMPVACLALARVVAGVRQVGAIRRKCTEVEVAALDPVLQDVLQPASGAGKQRRVRLLTSEDARVPAAIGFFHAAIVLPAWCLREMRAEELKPILIHELAHLRRRDDWTNLLQKAVRAVLFFHPAVWWIDARLAVEREMACDDAVLAATGNPRAYAGTLIGLLERSCTRRGWTMAQAAVARARDAAVRIARILEGKPAATTRVGRGALGLAAALCVTCCGVLAFTPQLVEFAPEPGTSPRLTAIQDHAIHSVPGGFGAPAVVPAIYRPQSQQHSPRMRKATGPNLAVAAISRVPEQTVAQKPEHSRVPVIMAKFNEPTRKQAGKQRMASVPELQMLMVVETAETGDEAAAPVIVGSSAQATPTSAAHPTAVPASIAGVVEIHTLQVLEQDATGSWHVRIYRVVTVVPAAEAGSMQSAI